MNTSGPAAPGFLYRSEAFAEDLPEQPGWSEAPNKRPRRGKSSLWVIASLLIVASSTALAWVGYRL